MDKDSRKPKTFVSTFRLAIKSPSRVFNVERKKEDGKDTRTLRANNNLEVSSATGKVQRDDGGKKVDI